MPHDSRILTNCHNAGIKCRTIPALAEIIESNGLASQIREVAVEDLLGRNPVRLEENQIRSTLEGKVVLVTGAAGSIGSELCRQIARFHPAGIVGFEIAESPLFEIDREMREAFPQTPFHPEIGSIQNRNRLDEVLRQYSPSVVYHAAAYKHVPMMEVHGHVVCSEDVVLDCLEDVHLHHWDMLVGCGMIDDRWRILAQNLVQAVAILYAPDLGVEGDLGERLAHFTIDFEEGRFGDFESDDPCGVEACNLSAEFGADGAGRTGDQYDLAFEPAADLFLFQLHGIAAQEIFAGDVADLGGKGRTFNDFRYRRHGAEAH